VKLHDGFIRFSVDDETSEQDYCLLMAELTADITGMRGAERDNAIVKQMQDMKKRRIVSKLKGE
jgi:hypothetical protein